jgi:SAM-dependent methyltransferase
MTTRRQNDFEGIMGERYKEAMEVLCPNDKKAEAILRKNIMSHREKYSAETLLDLGCGGGEFLYSLDTRPLASIPYKRLEVGRLQLTGIDISPVMIKKAQELFGTSIEREEVRIVQADLTKYLEAMILTVQRADIIISNYVLHNFTQEERARIFPLIYQALSDDGMFITEDKIARTNPLTHARDLERQYQRIESLAEHGMPELVEGWKQHYKYDEAPERILVERDLKTRLLDAGFPIVRTVYRAGMEAIVEARK